MDKYAFRTKLGTASKTLDDKFLNTVVKKSLKDDIKSFKGVKNLIIAMEELAECSQEISHYIRGRGDKYSLLEELADVYLGIKVIQHVCSISDEELNAAINVKLNREVKRIRK